MRAVTFSVFQSRTREAEYPPNIFPTSLNASTRQTPAGAVGQEVAYAWLWPRIMPTFWAQSCGRRMLHTEEPDSSSLYPPTTCYTTVTRACDPCNIRGG